MDHPSLSFDAYEACELCPRRCGVNRSDNQMGYCHSGATPRVARAALHPWEEPPISGEHGSGTVFFVGCTMGCVYCQNAPISHFKLSERPGRDVGVERLATIFVDLQSAGAHNINLVTPTHYAPHIVAAVSRARTNGLDIPIVYNTSGYERPEVIAALAHTVDVWLTDFKYGSATLAHQHARATDYARVARHALAQMREVLASAGGRTFRTDGTMAKGIIVRHLLLPGGIDNAKAVLDAVYEVCGPEAADISIMNQYTPTPASKAYGPPLDRPVTEDEYETVLDYADDLGFTQVWWQEGETVSESFIPEWDCSGV